MNRLADIDQYRKIILEGAVVIGLVIYGILAFSKGDAANGAWAMGLAGGYAFKNGYRAATKKSD